MSELLPCPFCGGEAELVEGEYGMYLTGYAIYCKGTCGAKLGVTGRLCEAYEWTPYFGTEAEAIAAWNSRVKRYPESLAQRMIVDGYEHELFELRNNYEHKLSELRQQLEKQQQIVHIAIKPLEEDSTLRIDDDGNMSLEAWKNIKAWNSRVDYHGYEQAAIEAWESIKAWNARATNGTLTAEQVKRIHEIIEKHWRDLPAEYDMPEATALPEYSYDWQAIADELNSRAERTCKVISHRTFCGAGGCEEAGELWTLSCGHDVMNDSDFPPNFCDECGCKVVGE